MCAGNAAPDRMQAWEDGPGTGSGADGEQLWKETREASDEVGADVREV
ncbi:hypothetical protein PC129_g9002 [Phytophthora cactorum]|uniref:Uncharacterized protein n=1 Tax=Phytophthora cactorum TaxID=29920 RepID=A0A329SSS6_9STRA|nr:hypothetical protein PC113_g11491 [Phytophthora cactorum]KAG2885098.1 hypothetical protein PC115_g21107 [Phytophthora cactorum]KAG2900466.1 hypothetical protein PC114_g13534 [Phytophthora cactorum]KAG2937638.1 hypothetical protein PC117_g11598 [Phytophthora cactorum]KAG2981246.1 hypothetical protein PC118_g10726 [Phytophthora cactorum]